MAPRPDGTQRAQAVSLLYPLPTPQMCTFNCKREISGGPVQYCKGYSTQWYHIPCSTSSSPSCSSSDPALHVAWESSREWTMSLDPCPSMEKLLAAGFRSFPTLAVRAFWSGNLQTKISLCKIFQITMIKKKKNLGVSVVA